MSQPPEPAFAPRLEKQELHQNGFPRAPLPPLNPPINPEYLTGGKKSLAGISITAFGLGITLGMTFVITLILICLENPLWRAPFFIATLALFHYLEFDMTARYNPPDAKIDSFLLTSNGRAYNIAHSTAMFEVLVRCWLRSSSKPDWLRLPFAIPEVFPTVPSALPIGLGLLLILVGQYSRSAAMATAGTSFNHIVQSMKKDDHALVTNGIYSFCRHPSYFGFFWWGLGTQLVLGNHLCFPAYAFVLWKFFHTRITREEKFLVEFFGQDYIDFRKRTPVLIPFIR